MALGRFGVDVCGQRKKKGKGKMSRNGGEEA
jgi:hypothetical protein